MRRALVWAAPAIAILALAAILLWPEIGAKPAVQPISPPHGLTIWQGAPTNEPPRREQRPSTDLPPAIVRWRETIVGRDSRNWEAAHSEVIDQWAVARPHIVRLASEDPDARIRANALNLLIVKKEIGLVSLFAQLLERDPSPYVRRNCCRALGELGAKERADLLRNALQDRDPTVVAAAREALAKLGLD